MDANQADRLAKFVGSGPSRRRILRAFLGGGLAVATATIGLDSTDAAGRCRTDGVTCGKDADCCSSSCLPKDRTGHRYCGEICIPLGDPCLLQQDEGSCCSGICGFTGITTICCTLEPGPFQCPL